MEVTSLRRLVLLSLLCAAPLMGRSLVSGYCMQGGQVVVGPGASTSTTKVQQSYPQCTITVYYTASAKGSVNTSGTAVTWEAGALFNANSGWAGLTITINSVTYTVASVASPRALTLTSSAGAQTGVSYSMPSTAPAPIFSDNSGTAKANPFTASTTGYWSFYTDNGIVDIKANGGGIPAPITWGALSVVDPGTLPVYLSDTSVPYVYPTVAALCSAGATNNVPVIINFTQHVGSSFTCTANLQFNGGMLQVAANQTATISPNFSCGDYQQCFNVSASGSSIAFSKSPSIINPNWYGADWTGTNDSTAAIVAAYAAMQAGYSPIHPITASTVLAFPAGVYRHTGLTFNDTMYVTGPHGSGATATLLYTGTVTSITMGGQPSGNFSNLEIISTTGSGSVSKGIDLSGGTEFVMQHIQIGAGSASGFATGLRIRTTGAQSHFDDITTSWCPTGVLFDFDSYATSSTWLSHGSFFAATVAGIVVRDVGSVTIENNNFEAVQNAIMINNSNALGVAAGLKILSNTASLITSFGGVTYTNPQFIRVQGTNVANALIVTGAQVIGNVVGGSPGNYCNTMSSSATSAGGRQNFSFSGNYWSGCTVAAVSGDDRVYMAAQNETLDSGVVEFAGAMSGNDLEVDGNGSLITTQYLAGVYQVPVNLSSALIAHVVTPTVSSCGASPTIGTGSNDRAGEVIVGTGGGITSCTVTFGTAFNSQVYGPITAIYIPPGSTVTQFAQSPSGFTITGTAMAGVQVMWAFPIAN